MAKEKTRATVRGTALYPKVVEADYKYKTIEGEFSVKLKPQSDEEGAAFQQELQTMYDEYYEDQCRLAKKKSLKKASDLPWKEETDEDTGEATGAWVFKFGMKHKVKTKEGKIFVQKPVIYNAKGDVRKTTDAWTGSDVKVMYEPNLWNTALGVGMSLRLKGIQIFKSVPRNSMADLVDHDEDGWDGDDSMDTTNSGVSDDTTTDDDQGVDGSDDVADATKF